MILLYLELILQPSLGRNMEDQLIKKEFMGKNLLALSVMWKYMEQRSFPLTEEEYLMRLDDVANTLKCWGAVSHIRNSLEKLKERPRIGKVSQEWKPFLGLLVCTNSQQMAINAFHSRAQL
ncbi:uncharacterized protein [Rutidosis leptorrhynchoides]|uniref:uncharacterized protein isoform X2 n=1 Tax=Rutidosis leptorrhynchoides TaxID=125765 RepID=UPI003A98DD96